MNYCSMEDLIVEVGSGELAALTAETGTEPDLEVAAAAMARAGAEIDAYLGKRYGLPLPEVPPLVKAMAVTLALYGLYGRRGVVPEPWQRRRAETQQYLEDLAAGRLSLTDSQGRVLPGRVAAVQEVTSGERVFKRETLVSF